MCSIIHVHMTIWLYKSLSLSLSLSLSFSLSLSQAELTEMYGTISQVKPSPSSSQLLLVVNQTKVYRHSYVADYLLYDNG